MLGRRGFLKLIGRGAVAASIGALAVGGNATRVEGERLGVSTGAPELARGGKHWHVMCNGKYVTNETRELLTGENGWAQVYAESKDGRMRTIYGDVKAWMCSKSDCPKESV